MKKNTVYGNIYGWCMSVCFCVFRLVVSAVTHHEVINRDVATQLCNQSVVLEVDEESSCPFSCCLLKMTGCH